LSEDDLPTILRAIPTLEALVQWAGPREFRFPLDIAQLRRYWARADGAPGSPHLFRASGPAGQMVGMIEIGMIDSMNASASLCRILILPEHRRRWLCTPIVEGALRIGFDDLCLRRIDLRVYAFNRAAIRCYERAGLEREGLLRQGQQVGDRLWDVILMAALRDEWMAPRHGRQGRA
jgi:RimJ/RimL family protein N-acetyltransferase